MNRFVTLLTATAALALAGPAMAQSDTAFTYQGVLNDGGQPVTGAYSVNFSLWDALSGGNEIGTANLFNTLAVDDGLFTVQLDFGAEAFDNSSCWLGISVDGTALIPRQPITRSPYSIQTRGIFVDANENVGIGTITPTAKLEVDATSTDALFAMTGANIGKAVYGLATFGTGASSGVFGHSNSNGGRGVYGYAESATGTTYGVYGWTSSSAGRGVYGHAHQSTGVNYGVHGNTNSPIGYAGYFTGGRNYFEGRVGIGTTNPNDQLEVVGGVRSSGPGGGIFLAFNPNNQAASVSLGWLNDVARIRIGGSGAGSGNGLDIQRTGNVSVLRVLSTGEVGIGTASPNYPLHVVAPTSSVRGTFSVVTAGTGVTYGVWGQSDSTSGIGVRGHAHSASGETYGVRGHSNSNSGTGVIGWTNRTTGTTYGVQGRSDSSSGRGVYGLAFRSSGINFGVLGRSNSSNGWDFYASGVGGNYGSSSSRRWKSNVVPIGDPLYKLAQLRGVYYDWDEAHGGFHDVGMIAEEVGEVMPEIVQYELNGIDAMGMDYSKMTPLLVEAVKALRDEKDRQLAKRDAQISAQATRLENLETENLELRERLADIETLVRSLSTHERGEKP